MEQQQDDRPLDFSTGRRASPPPYSAVAAGSSSSGLPSYPLRYPSPPDYSSSARPSVITCASSLRSSPAPSCPSPCGSTSSSTSQPRGTTGSPRPAADGQQQRREIISSGSFFSHFNRGGVEEKLVSGETFNYLGGGGRRDILSPPLAPLKKR